MEQRDAIVKNLREISHFFLSDSVAPKKEKAISKEDVSSVKIEDDNVQNDNLTNISKFSFRTQNNLPLVNYVLSENKDLLKTVFCVYHIASSLTRNGLKSCVVADRTTIEAVLKLSARSHDISSQQDNEMEIFDIQLNEFSLSLLMIGREHFDGGAQLGRYMDGIKTVFICDFPKEQMSEMIINDRRNFVTFFTDHKPEQAFKAYLEIKKLFSVNPSLWCGLVVNDVSQPLEGHKVCEAISNTLVEYSNHYPYYLGSLFSAKELESTENKKNVPVHRNSFNQIADQIIRHLPIDDHVRQIGS